MKISERIDALRREMLREGIDIYLVPTADYHHSEYVGEYFEAPAVSDRIHRLCRNGIVYCGKGRAVDRRQIFYPGEKGA